MSIKTKLKEFYAENKTKIHIAIGVVGGILATAAGVSIKNKLGIKLKETEERNTELFDKHEAYRNALREELSGNLERLSEFTKELDVGSEDCYFIAGPYSDYGNGQDVAVFGERDGTFVYPDDGSSEES